MNDFPRSVALVAGSDISLHRFRSSIVRKLREMDVIVYVIAPVGQFVTDIEKMGAVFIPWNLNRRSLNPLSAAQHLIALTRIYRSLKPNLVQHFTIKPNVYGAVAARLAGVPAVFGGVTGLGYAFQTTGRRHRILRSYALLLYRLTTKLSDCMIFQTRHDFDALLGTSSLSTKGRVLEGGSGIDLAVFSPDVVSLHHRERIRAELGIEPGMLVVGMVSRLLYDKGVTQYMEAARLVRSRRSNVCFLLAGEPDQGNPRSVTAKDLDTWASEDSVKLLGYRDDIQAILAISDVVAHPTYYLEGIPRILIEASAMGKPIVTTTMPGTTEIVEEGVNGVFVPPQDGAAVAAAIEGFLADADLRRRYGAAGRRKVESKYDDRTVADLYVAEYRRVWMSDDIRRRRMNATACAFQPRTTDSGTNQSGVSVSVIIPTYNEEASIAVTLDSVFSQEYAGPMEVVVADGSDSPATARIVQASYPAVRLVPNPERFTSDGLNHAIRTSTGDVIVRCDARSTLSPGYVRRVVETLERTGAANVGGRQQVVGVTFFEKTVGLAMNSLLGSGGTLYRIGGIPGPADTVYLGAWRRDTLEAVGGFNTRLIRNEDYELNWRLRQRGETVWFDPELAVTYRPRGSIASLMRQYFGYGRWKSTMLMMHPKSLQFRHLASLLVVLSLVAAAGLAIAGALWWAAALLLLYLAVLVLGSAIVGVRCRKPTAILLPIVLMVMHLSWGVGFFIPSRLSREVRCDTSSTTQN